MLSALDRSRSAMWPLALALLVGVMIGFAGGYGIGTRERSAPAAGSVATSAAAPSAAPGREFTESAVAPTSPGASAAKADAATRKSAAAGRDADGRTSPMVADGRLLVRSTPAGALVQVDGKDYGRTPAVVRDLARGGHRVRLTRDGYATEERRVTMTAAQPSQSITVALARSVATIPAAAARGTRTPSPAATTPAPAGRFVGVLIVVSRPPGASVYLDGKVAGTTPLSVPGISAGSHVVRLEHDGYRRWTSAVRVVANEDNRVTASLER
jgi:hypothetical protein